MAIPNKRWLLDANDKGEPEQFIEGQFYKRNPGEVHWRCHQDNQWRVDTIGPPVHYTAWEWTKDTVSLIAWLVGGLFIYPKFLAWLCKEMGW